MYRIENPMCDEALDSRQSSQAMFDALQVTASAQDERFFTPAFGSAPQTLASSMFSGTEQEGSWDFRNQMEWQNGCDKSSSKYSSQGVAYFNTPSLMQQPQFESSNRDVHSCTDLTSYADLSSISSSSTEAASLSSVSEASYSVSNRSLHFTNFHAQDLPCRQSDYCQPTQQFSGFGRHTNICDQSSYEPASNPALYTRDTLPFAQPTQPAAALNRSAWPTGASSALPPAPLFCANSPAPAAPAPPADEAGDLERYRSAFIELSRQNFILRRQLTAAEDRLRSYDAGAPPPHGVCAGRAASRFEPAHPRECIFG